jgi:hypothetical protein
LWRVGADPVPQLSQSSSPISHSVPTPAHLGQASTGSPRTFLPRASQSWSTSWPRFASHFIKTVFYFGTLNFGNALSLVRCAHTHPSRALPPDSGHSTPSSSRSSQLWSQAIRPAGHNNPSVTFSVIGWIGSNDSSPTIRTPSVTGHLRTPSVSAGLRSAVASASRSRPDWQY